MPIRNENVRRQWAEDQGIDPGRRGPRDPPPGGATGDAQVQEAMYGGHISGLPGLLKYFDSLQYPATLDELREQVGDRQVYIVIDFWVPVAALLDRLVDLGLIEEAHFESSAPLKEAVAANWPALSPTAWLSPP